MQIKPSPEVALLGRRRVYGEGASLSTATSQTEWNKYTRPQAFMCKWVSEELRNIHTFPSSPEDN